MDGVRGIRWWQKGREKVVGIFSLPFKKPPLGLPWTIKTINILDPLGVPFFAEASLRDAKRKISY